MITRGIGFVWKLLPGQIRLKIIRATQTKFTVSTAVVITNSERKVLLLNHVLRPFSGWGLPGGFMAPREQPEEGIRREIREETGIELDDLKMFRIRTVRKHVEILFTATTKNKPEIKAPREILELGWYGVDELPDALSRAQKMIIQEVVR